MESLWNATKQTQNMKDEKSIKHFYLIRRCKRGNFSNILTVNRTPMLSISEILMFDFKCPPPLMLTPDIVEYQFVLDKTLLYMLCLSFPWTFINPYTKTAARREGNYT